MDSVAVGQGEDRLGPADQEDVLHPGEARGEEDVRNRRCPSERGGVQTTRVGQPASAAGTAVISSVETSGAVPPGT